MPRWPTGSEAVNPDSTAPANDPFEALAEEMMGEDAPDDEEPAEAEGESPEPTAEDVTDDEAETRIEPPVSWKAEEKEKFKALPRETQEYIAQREAERERFVQSKAQEATQAKANAEREALGQLAQFQQQQALALQQALPEVPPRPSYNLSVTDPIAFAEQMEAHERGIAQHNHVQQRIQFAHQQAQQAQAALHMQEQQETQTVLQQVFPEYLDPTTGPKLREQLGSIALELGYSPEQLAQVNAKDILAMRAVANLKAKADKYDTLMAKKMETVREAKNLPKVARPGSAQPRSATNAQAAEAAFQRTKQTRNPADFADYLERAGFI